jgi:membrane protein YqaA with SNARE-associated domain
VRALFALFVTPVGLLALAALDSSIFFYAPLANDAVLVALAARDPGRFWLYPLIATAGSLLGIAATYWIGVKVGEAGLERLIRKNRLAKVKRRVKETGATAIGGFAIVPPPFPFTPLVLACGALEVSRPRLFATVALGRLARFGAEASLARLYGRRLLAWMESDAFRMIVIVFLIVAIAGSAYSIRRVVASTRGSARRGRRKTS